MTRTMTNIIAQHKYRAERIIVNVNGEETSTIWESELTFKERKLSGIYAWIENLHHQNRLLYIGMSQDVFRRLQEHHYCSGRLLYSHRKIEYFGKSGDSPVGDYISKLLRSKFEPCDQYDTTCDCIPRFYIEYVELKCSYKELHQIELGLIRKYIPPLNRDGIQ